MQQQAAPTNNAFMTDDAADAAIRAIEQVIRELARVAVDFGIPYGQLEDMAKQAIVDAAVHAPSGPVPISSLSVRTGIHRKDIKRIMSAGAKRRQSVRISSPAVLVTRWASDAAYLDEDGAPKPLPRRSAMPDEASFDTLARSVTSDVNPRTLLDELECSGLVSIDASGETVSLNLPAFIPSGTLGTVIDLARENAVDHMAAARANIAALAKPAHGMPRVAPFLEQAVFADELSADGASRAAQLATAEWLRVLRHLAPKLAAFEEEEKSAGKTATHRIRIGMYCYTAPLYNRDVLSPANEKSTAK